MWWKYIYKVVKYSSDKQKQKNKTKQKGWDRQNRDMGGGTRVHGMDETVTEL